MFFAGYALVGLPIAGAAGARVGLGRIATATGQAPPCCWVQTETVHARKAVILSRTGARLARVAALLAVLLVGGDKFVRETGHAGVFREQGLLGARRA